MCATHDRERGSVGTPGRWRIQRVDQLFGVLPSPCFTMAGR